MHTVQLDKDATGRSSMQQLNEALERNGMDVDTVYILDSAPSFSAPEYLASFAGIPAHVIVLNEFDGCSAGHDAKTTLTQSGAREMEIAVRIPSCAHFVFDSAVPEAMAQAMGNRTLPRGDYALYNLPSARITQRSLRDGKIAEIDFGDRLNIELKQFNAERSILLYYDWTSKSYRCMGDHCAG
jgi:hypothetical protein